MTKSVTIIDDSLRTNKVVMITPEIRLQFAKVGKIINKGYAFLPAIDMRTKRKIQDKVEVKRVFKDEHLEQVVGRAKRFIRSDKFADRVPPARHIKFTLEVFNKYDRLAFAKAVNNARSS